MGKRLHYRRFTHSSLLIFYISLRPESALLNVVSSAYSRSPPVGRPRASRVTRMPSGLKMRAMYMAVASPSKIGIGGDDQFFDSNCVGRAFACFHPPQQLFDLESFGANPLHRRNRTVKHMVQPLELAGALHSLHIQRLLHHANDGGVALFIIANVTWIAIGDVVANSAKDRLGLEFFQRRRQIQSNAFITSQQKIGKATCRLGANPRQTTKRFNQITDRLCERFQEWFLLGKGFGY